MCPIRTASTKRLQPTRISSRCCTSRSERPFLLAPTLAMCWRVPVTGNPPAARCGIIQSDLQVAAKHRTGGWHAILFAHLTHLHSAVLAMQVLFNAGGGSVLSLAYGDGVLWAGLVAGRMLRCARIACVCVLPPAAACACGGPLCRPLLPADHTLLWCRMCCT